MAAADFSQKKFLVVDDDEFAREYVENVLRSIGCDDIFSAIDGHSTLTALRIHRPDFVLLDIYLPGMDGWGLLEEIRHLLPSAAVIMITGSTLPADFSRSMGQRVDGYCIKPVLPDLMRGVLQKALARRGQ